MITTDAQDRTLGEIFSHPTVMTLEVSAMTDDTVRAKDDQGREWLVHYDGEILVGPELEDVQW